MERWKSFCGLVISLSQTLQKSRQREVRWWIFQTSSNLALLTGSEICLENPGERRTPGGCGVWQFQQMSYMRAVRGECGCVPKCSWSEGSSSHEDHICTALWGRGLRGMHLTTSHLGNLMTPSHLSLSVMQSFLLPFLHYHLIPSLGRNLQLFTWYRSIRKGINTFWWDLGSGNSQVNSRSISSLRVSIWKPFDAGTAQAISRQELLESFFIQVTEAFPRNGRTWVIFLLFFGSYREAWLAV